MNSNNNIYDQNHDSSKKYVVYITHYDGDKIPQNYIGSTNIQRINSGYKGSIRSKKYRQIWNEELEQNPHLFSIEIISYHDTRQEALYKELCIQKLFNIVNNPIFVNQAYATVNGFFGRDVSGKIHPMYGKTHSLESRYDISNNRNYNDISGDNNGRSDHNIYIFKNIVTNEIFEGSRSDFRYKSNIPSSTISEIINKEKMRKNWILAKNETIWLTNNRKCQYASRNRGSKHPLFDHSVYKIQNTISNEIYTGTKYDFRMFLNVGSSRIWYLINQHRVVKNWILLEKISE